MQKAGMRRGTASPSGLPRMMPSGSAKAEPPGASNGRPEEPGSGGSHTFGAGRPSTARPTPARLVRSPPLLSWGSPRVAGHAPCRIGRRAAPRRYQPRARAPRPEWPKASIEVPTLRQGLAGNRASGSLDRNAETAAEAFHGRRSLTECGNGWRVLAATSTAAIRTEPDPVSTLFPSCVAARPCRPLSLSLRPPGPERARGPRATRQGPSDPSSLCDRSPQPAGEPRRLTG
jgi:hypothetical protein